MREECRDHSRGEGHTECDRVQGHPALVVVFLGNV